MKTAKVDLPRENSEKIREIYLLHTRFAKEAHIQCSKHMDFPFNMG